MGALSAVGEVSKKESERERKREREKEREKKQATHLSMSGLLKR